MGFLQGMGIASQAGDQYDDQRQQRRMRDLQEEQARKGMMNQKVMQAIILRAAELAYGKKPGAAAQTPVQAPVAGTAPMAHDLAIDPRVVKFNDPNFAFAQGGAIKKYAKGGAVQASAPVQKFNGIYDAQKTKDGKLPSAWRAMQKVVTNKHLMPHLKKSKYKGSAQALQHVARFMQGGAVKKGKPKPIMPGQIVKMLAKGGYIHGPGTGTSDSIPATIDGAQPARLSNGEYVIPAAIVRKKGKAYFDRMVGKKGGGK